MKIGKFWEVVDTVCVNCVEDIFKDKDKDEDECKNCPVRKLSESLKQKETK